MIRVSREGLNQMKTRNVSIGYAALVALAFLMFGVVCVLFFATVIAGCGGSGTGFDNGGGGGNGGGERSAASFTGVSNTEYGVAQNDSRGPLAQSFVGDGGRVTRASF